MVNINLDFAVAATIHCQYQPRPTEAATIHGQYQPRPTVHYEPTSVHKTKKQFLQNCRKWAKNCRK